MTRDLFGDRGGAFFSACERYRYHLWRQAHPAGRGSVAFIMLNPSTADEVDNDPTVRRCIGFAADWRFARLDVLNIFALRSTDPVGLLEVEDPVGPENNRVLRSVALGCDRVVCAWGTHSGKVRPLVRKREQKVLELLAGVELYCLRVAKDGAPGHPLYLPAALVPTRWP